MHMCKEGAQASDFALKMNTADGFDSSFAEIIKKIHALGIDE